MHTEETRIERDKCTPMFTEALFTIARTWKQPRCPLSDEWKRKSWYIYTLEYYSAIKKDWIWVSSNEVDETGACYTESSKSERKTQLQYINALLKDQSWVFIGSTDAKAETPVLWPPNAKSWLIGQDSDAGREWGRRRRGRQDEMARWTWVWVNSGSW